MFPILSTMLKKLPLKFIILVSRSLLDCYSLFQNDNSWDSFFSFESRGFKLKYRANLIEIRIIYQFFIFNSRTVMVHCCQIVCIIEIDIGDIYIYTAFIKMAFIANCQIFFKSRHIVNRENCNSCPIIQYTLITWFI